MAALAQAFNQMTHDLQQRAAQLQAADRTRRLLLADVSHELMTPLTGMRGYLETLSLHAQSLDPETRERYLAIIRDETQRVEHIVGDLLDLSRLEGGGESFDAQDVPLEDLFGRVVARHGRAAEEKGVEIATSIAAGAEIVTGDPMRLEQALQNLAANALRHTPKGGRVALNAALEDGAIVVTVSDTGSGIAPEHLSHVFDRFYKVDPSRAGQAAGSGLGLSIVKAIVERHGGRVDGRQPGRRRDHLYAQVPAGTADKCIASHARRTCRFHAGGAWHAIRVPDLRALLRAQRKSVQPFGRSPVPL